MAKNVPLPYSLARRPFALIGIGPNDTHEYQLRERGDQLDVTVALGGLLGFDLSFTGESWDRFFAFVTEVNEAYERRALELDVRLGNT